MYQQYLFDNWKRCNRSDKPTPISLEDFDEYTSSEEDSSESLLGGKVSEHDLLYDMYCPEGVNSSEVSSSAESSEEITAE